jgi:hypothetical protein
MAAVENQLEAGLAERGEVAVLEPLVEMVVLEALRALPEVAAEGLVAILEMVVMAAQVTVRLVLLVLEAVAVAVAVVRRAVLLLLVEQEAA